VFVCTNVYCVLIHQGTLLLDMAFEDPTAAIFFSRSPNKFIVACSDDIFIVDASTQSTRPFSSTPQGAFYRQNALALSDDDAVLVAGNARSPCSVCGYDTVSLERLWIYDTADSVGAVCILSAHVLVTVDHKTTLLLNYKTGDFIADFQKAEGRIFGMGVIEGLVSLFL
jgi:hypothetical protein